MFLWSDLTARNVGQIGAQLHRIEGNADRQHPGIPLSVQQEITCPVCHKRTQQNDPADAQKNVPFLNGSTFQQDPHAEGDRRGQQEKQHQYDT